MLTEGELVEFISDLPLLNKEYVKALYEYGSLKTKYKLRYQWAKLYELMTIYTYDKTPHKSAQVRQCLKSVYKTLYKTSASQDTQWQAPFTYGDKGLLKYIKPYQWRVKYESSINKFMEYL